MDRDILISICWGTGVGCLISLPFYAVSETLSVWFLLPIFVLGVFMTSMIYIVADFVTFPSRMMDDIYDALRNSYPVRKNVS